MKHSSFFRFFLIACSLIPAGCLTQGDDSLLTAEDLKFLEGITREVADSSRILPGQDLPPAIRSFGPNRSGTTLIRPGGRDCYPSFWIRDYAMSLETGLFSADEQRGMLLYTAERQSDSTWLTATGSLVPEGSIPDHIRINDGLPVYFPGTYDPVYQGNEFWRRPPYCDQYYFIHMAWRYIRETGDTAILNSPVGRHSLRTRLGMAFRAVPASDQTGMAMISDTLPTCDFGFRDVIAMTGEVGFGSLLRWRAATEMAELENLAGNTLQSREYKRVASLIRRNFARVFQSESGMLRASTGRSSQEDVWTTAYAVHTGILSGSAERHASRALADAYRRGTISRDGQIRHVPANRDFSRTTAWEISLAGLNTYQNGAYWGTPTGWVCAAIDLTDPKSARRLAAEFVAHLRETDFRLDHQEMGGPWECEFPSTGHRQNPVYLASVACPYAVFKQSDQ